LEANQKPDCVIVDFDLPDGDGTELLKEVSGLLVLALIRSRNLERRGEAMGLGANQVLSTTGPPEKIVAAVERLIGPRSITAFWALSPECVEGKFYEVRP
jgi:DNA-binding NarL/FixJ family response regulator